MKMVLLIAATLVLVAASCFPAAPPVAPDSPLQAPSPLPTAARAPTFRAYAPFVRGPGWTLHGFAMDGYAGKDWRIAEAVAEAAGAPLCQLWWWGPGMACLPACRGLAECRTLYAGQVAAFSPSPYVLIANEPNNPDTAGGGWPETPAAVAAYLKERAPGFRAEGKQVACCSLYLSPDNKTAEVWWDSFKRAGGLKYVDICTFHVFATTTRAARATQARGERLCGSLPLAITEAGWNRAVVDPLQAIDDPRYRFVLVLWSATRR